MENGNWNMLLPAVLLIGIAAAAEAAFYYGIAIHRMSEMLHRFEVGDKLQESDTRDTRESKLVSQLKRLLDNVDAREARAVEERDKVSGLLSDLSHQLKTPLANIVMDTELLQDEALTGEERSEFLGHAREQTEKMQWLMKTLLKASRLEQGMIVFESGYHSIRDTLAMGIGAVYAQAEQKQISIETEAFRDCTLFHNPKWTAEALANVLENAVKYSPVQSTIHIRMSPLDIYTRIEVEDEGVGIPKEEYNRIFQRFYRGKYVEQEEGSGLGLYLAQLIMREQRGYITVTSQKDKGSRFSFYLLRPADHPE